MKKNNTAQKAALDAEKISKALKEGTQKSLQEMLNEAIAGVVNEGDDEDDEKEYDVEDVDTEGTDAAEADADTEEAGAEALDADANEGEGDEGEGDDAGEDEWSDMEDYKVGDDEYDLTNADGDEALKVYNKLGDDDQIFVKKDEDGKYTIKDGETGAEYVIEFDADAIDDEEDLDDEDEEGEELEFDIDTDDEEDGEEGDIEFDIESDGYEDGEEGDGDGGLEIDFASDDDDDAEELNEENLGYTTTYQKDVMPGLKNNEPADSKATYSMDAGAPTGTSRPYSGYRKEAGKPFTDSINEGGIGHKGNVVKRTTAKTQEKDYGDVRNNSKDGEYTPGKDHLDEAMRRIVAKAKMIQEDNKKYKKAIADIKKSLCEAAVLNVTLGQVIKLLKENSTTKEEKERIVERFSAVKTIKEGQELYGRITKELNESRKTDNTGAAMLGESLNVQGSSKTLNETKIYGKRDNNPSIDLMIRMDNLYK